MDIISMKSELQDNDIQMYSTHIEEKSFFAERFYRAFKNEIYKYLTLIPKNIYIDELDDIVDKYNNTYHSTIKIKPADLKSGRCTYFAVEKIDKDHIF